MAKLWVDLRSDFPSYVRRERERERERVVSQATALASPAPASRSLLGRRCSERSCDWAGHVANILAAM